jgi:hypothetical protein
MQKTQLQLFETLPDVSKIVEEIRTLYLECKKEWDEKHAIAQRYSTTLWDAKDFLKLPPQYQEVQSKGIKIRLDHLKIWLDKMRNYTP